MNSTGEVTHHAIVVEDDAVSAKMLARQLEKHAFEVAIFNDGKSAWEHIKTVHVPACLILDWQLPELDGISLCRSIQELEQSDLFYTLMVTGSDSRELIRDALLAGAQDFLSKPIDPKQFFFRLEIARAVIQRTFEQQVEAGYLEMRAQEMEILAKAREDQLVQADRLVTLGTLAAGVAHEINNPTTFISGNAQMLEKFWGVLQPTLGTIQDSNPDLAQQITFMEQEIPGIFEGIKTGVTRIRSITDGLKHFVHKSDVSLDRTSVSAKELIANCIRFTEGLLKNKVEIDTILKAEADTIYADKTQIEQVFINLIVNASHAVEKSESPKIIIQLIEQEMHIRIAVADNGCGMDRQALKRIWEPFFTTKEVGKGTGLGLPIVRSIIEAHDGTIACASTPGKGTVFTVQLPKFTSQGQVFLEATPCQENSC